MLPAYRIETDRLALRCFELADAPSLHALLADDAGHLARFLVWVRDEPRTLPARVELVRGFRASFDGDIEYVYGVFDRGDGRLHGSVALRMLGLEPYVATIGYWLARESCGRGLAFEACAALVRVAFEVHALTRLEIHCDASNERSRALAARLGFHLDAELRERGHAPGEARAVHSLLASEFTASPAGRCTCSAFDALGEPILLSSTRSLRA